MYFVVRFWPVSPVLYFASIFAKALTAPFLPFSLFFIARSHIPNKNKIIIAGIISVIITVGGVAAVSSDKTVDEEFSQREFWMGFTSFAYQLRFDGLILMFIVPLIVGLFLASRRGIPYADTIMVLISGMLIVAPFLTGYTSQTNQPYRFVPLVVFFAMGVGVLLSRRSS